ncbi:hypothetical protein [Planomonospora venezuelensis]|uniref:Uncharacterized protein n=1 Tax=Planomonospora venezuelensis TaxID=1999 RepID=A0A841D964_PLAVE|nr:hypothetical protein [Planomonospora venezuelensis]MBB5966741.1 hypothetical protein [Planomonospora venezuelensis]GIN01756.1 hypothetical protein Pve01_34140 [Planomonospora venezuelensis]
MSPAVEESVLDVDLGPPGRASRRRALAVLTVVAAAAVALGAWLLLRAAPGPAVSSATPAPSSGVVLAAPSAYHGEAGYPVGFPRTELGAVSAAAAALEAAWTLDAAQAEQAAVLYALPEQREAARDGADATVRGWRKTLGLPEEGELPEGAALRTETVGVQWHTRAPDQVQVSLLVRVDAVRGTAEAGPSYSSPFAMSVLMVWSPGAREGAGDWVNTPDPLPAVVPEVAAPGTPEFTAAGWQAVARPSS